MASSRVPTLTIRRPRRRVLYRGGGGGGRREGPDSSHNSVSHFALQFSTQFSAQFAAQHERLVGSFENLGLKINGLVLTFQLSFALSFASVFSNVNAPNVAPKGGLRERRNSQNKAIVQVYIIEK